MPEQEYPVDATTGDGYRITGSITWQRLEPPPFDIVQTDIIDNVYPAPILAVGVLRRVVTFGDGSTAVFSGVGVRILDNSGVLQVVLFGERNLAAWKIIGLGGLAIARIDTPTVPLLGGFPASTQPQPGDSPNNDLAFPITIPGGIPGLLLPARIPITILQPHRLGQRPVPVGYPPSLPAAQREALPQMWLLPGGIQVGQGSPGDIVITTTPDTIPNTGTPTQTDDLRQRIPPPTVICLDTPEPPQDICDCEEIRDIVFEELDKKFPPKRPVSNLTVSFGAAESNTLVLPEFSTFVELTIVTKPPNVRTQTGGDDAPEVSFNGWYSFGATNEASERIPFHYDAISIPVPAGVSAFSYTVYQGGTASITVGYKLPAL